MSSTPEAWLRGPVPGVDPLLMPVAHALVQVRDELDRLRPELEKVDLWQGPGTAAPPGFQLRHLAGSLDRLFTYARGERLDSEQGAALLRESSAGTDAETAGSLVDAVTAQIDRCLDQVRRTSSRSLVQARAVGKAGLPSTVGGLLFHGAEHATRHVGQLVTTLKALRS